MKRLYLAVALLLTLLCLSLASGRYMLKLTDSLADGLGRAEVLARRDEWALAEAVTRQCLEDWNAHRAYLHVLCNHDDTDQIAVSFQRALQHILLEQMDEYTAENRELITKIRLLADMEQPDVLNVF